MRGLHAVLLSCTLLVVLAARTVHAQAPPSSPPPTSPPPVTPASPASPPPIVVTSAPPPATPLVTMREVDLATVRVIALDSVAIEAERGPITGMMRDVADPRGGHGSGLAVDHDGLVLTARHVIDGAVVIAVIPANSDTAFPAQVVYSDPNLDFAFVRVRTTFEHVVPLPQAAPSLQSGEAITVAGYPLDPRERTPAIASGLVSRATNDGRLQLSISLNPGNSGGPVTNGAGVVVGVISQRGSPQQGVQGIAFAVPLAPIIAAYQSHPPALLPPAANPADEQQAASLVADLVRGVDPNAQDAHAQLEQFHRRLIESAQRSDHPVLLVLAAADVWNLLMVWLEQRRVPEVAYLAPAERRDAEQMVAFIISACERAAQRDPTVRQRFPFAYQVLTAVDKVRAAPRAQPWQQQPPGAGSCFGAGCTQRPARFGVTLGANLLVDLLPGGRLGGTGSVGFHGLPLLVGQGRPVQFGLLLGTTFAIGGWRGEAVVVMQAEVGARLRLGRPYGAAFTLAYTPGLVLAEQRLAGSWLAGRADVAVALRDILLGLRWQEANRALDTPLRAFSAFVEFGF